MAGKFELTASNQELNRRSGTTFKRAAETSRCSSASRHATGPLPRIRGRCPRICSRESLSATLAAALKWYETLFGSPPSFYPNDTEAVWTLAEHRHVFIELRPEHTGHTRHLVFVDDLEGLVARIRERGLGPVQQETLADGVRKVAYRDPDGNQFEFGGAPV